MKKTKFSESQIVAILQEGEAGLPVAQILRKYGISQATYYNWKSKYGGASVAELKRLKELEVENAKLKRMYADLALENAAIKDVLGRKPLTPSAKRESIRIMTEEHGVSVKRACQAARLSRAAYYRPEADRGARDREVIEALNEIVSKELRWGFWKCFDRLRQMGKPWNHKRVHRVYCQMRLNQKRRTKRRLPTRERQPLMATQIINAVWALDFMHDTLYSGRTFRTLNVIDEADRGCLGIDLSTSIPAARVIRFVEQLIEIHGKPAAIRCDNGPELTSYDFTEWCKAKDIELRFIQPGKPDQNAYIERFNRTYREEVLNAYLFDSISEVREITDDWLGRYNEIRPHDALGSL
ncbi:MAG: IS3 family transposase, partial [Burkholderiaceae bacterium]|nr:IS3 family transposase [Burkholderiaceae bacterium]